MPWRRYCLVAGALVSVAACSWLIGACTCQPVGCVSQETLLIDLPGDIEALGIDQVTGCRNEVCWTGHLEPPFDGSTRLLPEGDEEPTGASPLASILQERDGSVSLQLSWEQLDATDPLIIREGDVLAALAHDESGAEIASGMGSVAAVQELGGSCGYPGCPSATVDLRGR